MGMGYSSSDLKLTQEYSERILRLPMHNGMNKDDAQYISKLVVEGIEEYRG
jgi:dTDP-4-amino-4,6-dideoxygalactose transaminase